MAEFEALKDALKIYVDLAYEASMKARYGDTWKQDIAKARFHDPQIQVTPQEFVT